MRSMRKPLRLHPAVCFDSVIGAEFLKRLIPMLDGRRVVIACAMALLTLRAGADDSSSTNKNHWSESFTTRLEALALLQTLNAELLSYDSATITLEHWCIIHHMAAEPRIVAEQVHDIDKPISPVQRQELGISPAETVRYRRVNLRCGALVLSQADNWYVPSRLTPEMNKLLDTTDIPFGKIVQALRFQRHTLWSKVLWWPLPEGWEMQANIVGNELATGPMPALLLEHKAVLTLPDGTPFSEVVESYTDRVMDFPLPHGQ
jgi:chorismate-pyruvate lyase